MFEMELSTLDCVYVVGTLNLPVLEICKCCKKFILLQSIIYYGKVARKHGLSNVCNESLKGMHNIHSMPLVDCFQKIRQQIKCCLQMASMGDKKELNEGLEMINNTNVCYFNKEMTAELYALKGLLYHLGGKYKHIYL